MTFARLQKLKSSRQTEKSRHKQNGRFIVDFVAVVPWSYMLESISDDSKTSKCPRREGS